MSYQRDRSVQEDAQFAADMQMAYDLQAQEEVQQLQEYRQNHANEYSQNQANDSTRPFSQALRTNSRNGGNSFPGSIPVVEGRSVPGPRGFLPSRRSTSGARSAISSDGLSMRQNQSLVFVPAEINGRVVEMMVDTGAQSSVISAQLMRTLGLQSKLNTSMQGVAQGVGQARILGVIENCPVSIGHVEFLLYFLVLDVPQDMMIMGIDQMRRFKCLIDLENNKVRFYFG